MRPIAASEDMAASSAHQLSTGDVGYCFPPRRKGHADSLRGMLMAKYRSDSSGNLHLSDAATRPWPSNSGQNGDSAASGQDSSFKREEPFCGDIQLEGCSVCGDDAAVAWFSLESLVQQPLDPFEGIFSGHESDESGCSASSHISQQQPNRPVAEPNSLRASCADSLADMCFLSASAVDISSLETALPCALGPDQDTPGFSEADLQMCLDVACQDLGVEGVASPEPRDGASPHLSNAAVPATACFPSEAALAPPLLRAISTNSSSGMSYSGGFSGVCSNGADCCQSGNLEAQHMIAHNHAVTSNGNGQRKRGRPRRYDTTLPLLPGAMEAQVAAAMAGHINGVDAEKRKRTRGAKPKYQFLTAEEAVAHRRERNRTTALASYEKRKARENALKLEITQLEREQAALKQLLQSVQQPGMDTGMVRELLTGPEASGSRVWDLVSMRVDDEFLRSASE